MRRVILSLATGILSGLLVASVGFAEVVVQDSFESSWALTWEKAGDPAVQLLQTSSSGSKVYYNELPWGEGRLESLEGVDVATGTTIEFDSWIPMASDQTGSPWGLVAIGNKSNTNLNPADFHLGAYIWGETDEVYFFTSQDTFTAVPVSRGVCQRFKVQIVEDGYVEFYVDGTRAGRLQTPITGDKLEGPVVVFSQYMAIDNIVTGTEPEDTVFTDGFDGCELGEAWEVTGTRGSYISTSTGLPKGSFHATATDLMECSAQTSRCFQSRAGITINFDAMVPKRSKALVCVGVLTEKMVTDAPDANFALVLNNDMKSIGLLMDGQYGELDRLDNEWHSYTVKVDLSGTITFFQDGYPLYVGEFDTDMYPNVPVFISARDGYIDNLEIR